MSNIPTLPLEPRVKDGKGSTSWLNYDRQLNTELQTNNSEEGMVAPSQTTANITSIAAGTNSQTPRLIFDSDAGALKFVVNGVVKTVTVT